MKDDREASLKTEALIKRKSSANSKRQQSSALAQSVSSLTSPFILQPLHKGSNQEFQLAWTVIRTPSHQPQDWDKQLGQLASGSLHSEPESYISFQSEAQLLINLIRERDWAPESYSSSSHWFKNTSGWQQWKVHWFILLLQCTQIPEPVLDFWCSRRYSYIE